MGTWRKYFQIMSLLEANVVTHQGSHIVSGRAQHPLTTVTFSRNKAEGGQEWGVTVRLEVPFPVSKSEKVPSFSAGRWGMDGSIQRNKHLQWMHRTHHEVLCCPDSSCLHQVPLSLVLPQAQDPRAADTPLTTHPLQWTFTSPSNHGNIRGNRYMWG